MPRIFPTIQPGLITRETADTLNQALAEVGRLVQGFHVDAPLCLTDDAGGVKVSLDCGSLLAGAGSHLGGCGIYLSADATITDGTVGQFEGWDAEYYTYGSYVTPSDSVTPGYYQGIDAVVDYPTEASAYWAVFLHLYITSLASSNQIYVDLRAGSTIIGRWQPEAAGTTHPVSIAVTRGKTASALDTLTTFFVDITNTTGSSITVKATGDLPHFSVVRLYPL